MEIVNLSILNRFVRKHSDAAAPIASWRDKVEAVSWDSLVELKETFRTADYHNGMVIFNIGGNNYRLLTTVNFASKTVTIIDAGTHADYDRWNL